jgi:pimeloyl-ACP methyl ester carboxylesterase
MPRVHRQIAAGVRNGLIRSHPDVSYADGDDAAWMSVDWPAMTRRLTVLGTAINLVDTGEPAGAGAPLVWIHGLSGRWQNWLLNLPAFMGDHRCVAMDLPGFGESELPTEAISIQGYARTVDAVLAALGIDSCVVIGNSMGGFIGAEVALAFPTRVQKLVLVSAAGLAIEYQRREPLMTLARLTAHGVRDTGQHARAVIRRRRLRRAAMQMVVRYPEKLSLPLAFEQVQGSGKPGFLAALDALMSYSFRNRLAEIEVPVLIVWGANDMLVPVGDARRFEKLIGPNARKVIFDDTGHLAMLERPTRFNRVLGEFLAGRAEPEAGVEGVRHATTAAEDAAASGAPDTGAAVSG